MKLLKLAATAAVGLSMAGSALAIDIYITGSTAMRAIGQQGIQNILNNPDFEGTNADALRANHGLWTGKFNGENVRIKVAYGGSTGGIQTTAGSIAIKFVADATPTADPNVAGNASETAIPDITFTDTYQSSTTYNGTFQGRTYVKLVDTILCVQGFKWIAGKGFGNVSNVRNFTNLQAEQLLRRGAMPLAIVTGKPADKKITLFAVGRNPDSGTRLTTVAESGLSPATLLKQYQPTITGAEPNASGFVSGGKITGQVLYPVEVINGESTIAPGNSGFSSGSGVAGALTAKMTAKAYRVGNPNAEAGFYVGYVGLSDATSAISEGGVELTWNGVPFSNRNIAQGSYTFWSYAHLMYRQNIPNGKKEFADTLATQMIRVESKTTSSLVPLGKMSVKRNTDGGIAIPKYF